jgi:quercetin dioxygenase-like cupin family protein
LSKPFEIFHGLAGPAPEIPAGAIVSREVFDNEQVHVSVLGFAAGQELYEAAPDVPAILEVWQGSGLVTLYEETHEISPGSWIYISDEMPHAIRAETEMVVLLTLLK